MARECRTCGHYKEDQVSHAFKCSRGDEAESYCLGDIGLELWFPVDGKADKEAQEIVAESVAEEEVEVPSHDTDVFDPDTVETGVSPVEGEERELGSQEHPVDEEALAKTLSPEQQEALEHMKEAIQELEKRPKTSEEGYNGRKKEVGVVLSATCNGCINLTMIGCFLGKYYECVDNGRYLFQSNAAQAAGAEEIIETKEAQVDIDFINHLLGE